MPVQHVELVNREGVYCTKNISKREVMVGRVEKDTKVTLDNTFSMFRAKSVKVWLVVNEDGLEDEECEDGDDENEILF